MRLSLPPHSRSATEIARDLSISERTVQRYRAMSKKPSQVEPREELDSEVDALVMPLRRYIAADVDDLFTVLNPFEQAGEPIPLEVFTEELTGAFHLLEAAVDAFVGFYERYSGQYFPSHAREWIREALSCDRLLLNVPPRHAKSEILTVWYSIWRIACDRNIQILIISQTEKLAKKFAGKIAWVLEFHPLLIKDFGRFKPYDDSSPWRPLSGEITVEGRTRTIESGDMTLQIRGKGQQILGMEADIILGDDIVGREDAWSAAERDKTSEYWHGDVSSRRSPKSKMLVVGQCLHHQDLYAELGEKIYSRGSKTGQPLWKRILYPAVSDWDAQKVLWKREWPFDRLMETYEDLKRKGDAWLFEAMYQQNPLPSSARLVIPEWIYANDGHHIGCLDDGLLDHPLRRFGQRVQPREVEDGQPREIWVPVVSVDPSPERMTGIIVADVRYAEDFECGILEATRARLDVRGILEQLERIARVYHPEYLIFEHNAFARWFLQDPRFQSWDRTHGVRVIPHTTGRNKSDEQYGLQTLGPLFEFGRIRLPWGDTEAMASSKMLIEEATNYMPEAPKASAYSDLLMALWFIYYQHRQLFPQSEQAFNPSGQAGRGFRAPKRLQGGFKWAR